MAKKTLEKGILIITGAMMTSPYDSNKENIADLVSMPFPPISPFDILRNSFVSTIKESYSENSKVYYKKTKIPDSRNLKNGSRNGSWKYYDFRRV